ncbi:hypothetical protein D1007_39300 [Hordeum vulgare]|nr:hypothetical protein D1007_39300 [Hordeum vulgare]
MAVGELQGVALQIGRQRRQFGHQRRQPGHQILSFLDGATSAAALPFQLPPVAGREERHQHLQREEGLKKVDSLGNVNVLWIRWFFITTVDFLLLYILTDASVSGLMTRGALQVRGARPDPPRHALPLRRRRRCPGNQSFC